MAEENVTPGENQDEAASTAASQTNQSSVKVDEDLTPEELAVQQGNEDFILNFKDEDLEDEDKAAKLEEALKNAKTTVAQKRHYREKFAAATKSKAPEKPGAAAAPNSTPSDDTKELILELRQDNPWLSKESAAEVVRLSKVNNETIEETLKRPYVASWLEKEKNSKDIDDASVAPSRNGGGGNGAGSRDWSNATPEEMDKERARIMSQGNG